MEMKSEDKDYELDCAMHDIRRVENLKANKPEIYNKAVDALKMESKQIDSLEKLKAVAKEKADSKEMVDSVEEDDSEEESSDD